MRLLRLFLRILASTCVCAVLWAQAGTPQQEKPASSQATSNWHTIVGKVASADVSKNLLVVKISGGELKLNVPGRVNLLEIKPGDKVRVRYTQSGRRLQLRSLTKVDRQRTAEEAKK